MVKRTIRQTVVVDNNNNNNKTVTGTSTAIIKKTDREESISADGCHSWSFVLGILMCCVCCNIYHSSLSVNIDGGVAEGRRQLLQQTSTATTSLLLQDALPLSSMMSPSESEGPITKTITSTTTTTTTANKDQTENNKRDGPSLTTLPIKPSKRILVVYSGPSSSTKEEKVDLYQRNLDYFIHNGGIVLDSSTSDTTTRGDSIGTTIHDTIIVVGHEFFPKYHAMVEQWKEDEQQQQASSLTLPIIKVVSRRPVCYDMETARMAFYGELGVNIKNYDYFVFVNCGLTGPGYITDEHINPQMQSPTTPSHQQQPLNDRLPWTLAFTSMLNEKIKMTGLSINMYGLQKKIQEPHIQSFLYALDQKGIQIVREAKSIFDCLNVVDDDDENNKVSKTKLLPRSRKRLRRLQLEKKMAKEESMYHQIITRYEIGMSTAILNAGYGIAPLLHPRQSKCSQIFKRDTGGDQNTTDDNKCRNFDMWYEEPLTTLYMGRMPSLNETLFFKTSRIVTPEIAKLIHYNETTTKCTTTSSPPKETFWWNQLDE